MLYKQSLKCGIRGDVVSIVTTALYTVPEYQVLSRVLQSYNKYRYYSELDAYIKLGVVESESSLGSLDP